MSEIISQLAAEAKKFKFDTRDVLKVKRLRESTPEVPAYATPGSAGLDLRADFGGMVKADERHTAPDGKVWLHPGEKVLVPTGFSIELPVGFEGQVRSRSGLANKHSVVVLNSPGTVDSDYRGEVGVILANLGGVSFAFGHGDRIAQLVIARVEQLPIETVETLSSTERGAGGFGSTGVK